MIIFLITGSFEGFRIKIGSFSFKGFISLSYLFKGLIHALKLNYIILFIDETQNNVQIRNYTDWDIGLYFSKEPKEKDLMGTWDIHLGKES